MDSEQLFYLIGWPNIIILTKPCPFCHKETSVDQLSGIGSHITTKGGVPCCDDCATRIEERNFG